MKCTYRRIVHTEQNLNNGTREYMYEEFQDCIGKECTAYKTWQAGEMHKGREIETPIASCARTFGDWWEVIA
jgi:hypothetical protein